MAWSPPVHAFWHAKLRVWHARSIVKYDNDASRHTNQVLSKAGQTMNRAPGESTGPRQDEGNADEAARGATSASLSERARTVIEDLIYQGELTPGAALDERELAEQLGMSRTPIREAIQQLQVQGLVRAIPRHGAFVAKLSIRELL